MGIITSNCRKSEPESISLDQARSSDAPASRFDSHPSMNPTLSGLNKMAQSPHTASTEFPQNKAASRTNNAQDFLSKFEGKAHQIIRHNIGEFSGQALEGVGGHIDQLYGRVFTNAQSGIAASKGIGTIHSSAKVVGDVHGGIGDVYGTIFGDVHNGPIRNVHQGGKIIGNVHDKIYYLDGTIDGDVYGGIERWGEVPLVFRLPEALGYAAVPFVR